MSHHICEGVTIDEISRESLSSTDLNDVFDGGYVCLKLAHYRNQILHWFIPEAMILMCIHGPPEIQLGTIKILVY